ncbi:hypothetical protein [Streptomyces sp. NPDC047070]|uniref:hypothetical protein n=1 Tax=Streptomyces sp. NPDC047070 TaxID=3154923 RepID=UPI0034561450
MTRTRLFSAPHAVAILNEAKARQLGPLDEGRLFRVLDEAGFTHHEIGKWYGEMPTHIRWRIELLDLIPAGRSAVEEGRVPVGLGWYIALLGEENQRLMLARWARGDFADVYEAQNCARAIRNDSRSA